MESRRYFEARDIALVLATSGSSGLTAQQQRILGQMRKEQDFEKGIKEGGARIITVREWVAETELPARASSGLAQFFGGETLIEFVTRRHARSLISNSSEDRIWNFGQKSLREVEQMLETRGLRMGMTEDEALAAYAMWWTTYGKHD